MSLYQPPQPPALSAAPFLLRGLETNIGDYTAVISASFSADGLCHEYRLSGRPAEQLRQLYPDELPLALELTYLEGEWQLRHLGGPEVFASGRAVTPMSAEQLSSAQEQMLRESLGIPEGEPLPEPEGPLAPAEQPEEPYKFHHNLAAHLDLSVAEPPPALPPPAPPGPPPAPGAETAPANPVPPPGRPVGAFGDASVPFAH